MRIFKRDGRPIEWGERRVGLTNGEDLGVRIVGGCVVGGALAGGVSAFKCCEAISEIEQKKLDQIDGAIPVPVAGPRIFGQVVDLPRNISVLVERYG